MRSAKGRAERLFAGQNTQHISLELLCRDKCTNNLKSTSNVSCLQVTLNIKQLKLIPFGLLTKSGNVVLKAALNLRKLLQTKRKF